MQCSMGYVQIINYLPTPSPSSQYNTKAEVNLTNMLSIQIIDYSWMKYIPGGKRQNTNPFTLKTSDSRKVLLQMH